MRFINRLGITFFSIVTVFGLLLTEAKGQSLEVGISGGGSYMLNDSVRAAPFKNGGYSVGVLGRYNFNSRWAVRFSYNYNKINFNRQGEYNGIYTAVINDISMIAEFNFLDYVTGSKYYTFSPYLFGGVSGFVYNNSVADSVSFSGALTFGAGIKYSLTKKVGMGVEWGMRKTFTDNLDGDDKMGTFWYGSDWYGIVALSITYKFDIYKNNCKKR